MGSHRALLEPSGLQGRVHRVAHRALPPALPERLAVRALVLPVAHARESPEGFAARATARLERVQVLRNGRGLRFACAKLWEVDSNILVSNSLIEENRLDFLCMVQFEKGYAGKIVP